MREMGHDMREGRMMACLGELVCDGIRYGGNWEVVMVIVMSSVLHCIRSCQHVFREMECLSSYWSTGLIPAPPASFWVLYPWYRTCKNPFS